VKLPRTASVRTTAKILIPLAILAAFWYVDDRHPSRLATTLAELVLGSGLAAYVAVIARERLRNAAIAVASILFGLAGAEAYALSVLAAGRNVIQTPGFQVVDPVMGWRAGRPGVFRHTKHDSQTGRPVVDVEYTIDQQRNRQVLSAESGPAIAFFGDSFTFGEGLPDAETLPQLFADLTDRKWHVLNLAGIGYGPQQFLRPLETGLFDDVLKEPRVFVFQTAAWHSDRSSCAWSFMMTAARYTLTNGQPIYRGLCQERWGSLLRSLMNMSMYKVYLQPLLVGARAASLDLYIAVLGRAGELARQKYGVPTVILYIPDPDYLRGSGYTDQQIVQRLRERGLIVVDGALEPADFPGQDLSIPGDGHPTGVANRARAMRLRDAVAGMTSLGTDAAR
jgi:hypothetical protein